MSNCCANSASVLSPRTAAKATFALKAGVWFRRGRFVMISPVRHTSWPLSGRNSTYPAVQISRASSLEDMPIRWLGAHNRAEVIQQLDTEPGIACVVMGAGLDDTVRGDLVGVIAARRPDITIHLKDRASGPDGLLPFTRPERVNDNETAGVVN